MRPHRFRQFVAIDWSGAVGERQSGIALALCDGDNGEPKIIRPGHRWSRSEVLDWLSHDLPDDTLVGMDLGMALPFSDHGAFLPAWPQSPPDARCLWAMVDEICAADPHLAVSSFVDHPEIAPHFRRHAGRQGIHFGKGRGRLRVTEQAQESMGCRPYSNFNLVGAAQVGKSSLSGMRLLNRLPGHLAIWPFEPIPDGGSVILEIYTTIAAMAAGRPPGRSKMRSGEELDAALLALASMPTGRQGPIDDHASDAILTSAWLRRAAHCKRLWHPAGLDKVAQTEGWTFGAT